MNDPIINPWIFYFADISYTIKMVAAAFTIGVGIIEAIVFFVILNETLDGVERNKKKDIKIIKNFSIIFCINFLFAIFMPTSETVYKMAITQQITPANIQAIEETGKDFVDYIVEKVKETNN